MDEAQFAELVAALDSVGAAIQSQSGLIDLLANDNANQWADIAKQWDAIAALRDDLHAVASVRDPDTAALREFYADPSAPVERALRSVDDDA